MITPGTAVRAVPMFRIVDCCANCIHVVDLHCPERGARYFCCRSPDSKVQLDRVKHPPDVIDQFGNTLEYDRHMSDVDDFETKYQTPPIGLCPWHVAKKGK